MSDFATLLAQYTKKDSGKIHGAIAKIVDKNGHEISSFVSGFNSVSPSATPLTEDAVLKFASASKLFTSIALLQCVDDGLIGLDEPLTHIIPELDGKEILQADGSDPVPSKTKITARHLITHTSGLGYRFMHPLLMKWGATPAGQEHQGSKLCHLKYNHPLVFEPGQGWAYGTSLDWAGIVVRRLHGGISLEEYMIERIWKPVGRVAPFPRFCISRDAEYKARLLQGAERNPSDGGLREYEFWQGDNPEDQDGGHGLCATVGDCIAVLADLVADQPKLLKRETAEQMFKPQIEDGSPAMKMLLALRPAHELVGGPGFADDGVNHGLGGVLMTKEVEEIRQPANVLAWGGAANFVWWASRDEGVAGVFATQLNPFGDKAAKELINAWRKEFWASHRSK